MAKVLWLSESMQMPSGFGQQTKLVCEGLAKQGHDVTVICQAGPKFKGKLPPNLREWRFDCIYDVALVERLAEKLRPDVVVIFWCLTINNMMLQVPTVPANAELCVWMPWEGTSLPEGHEALSCVPPGRFVHLSQYSQKLWSPSVESNVIIPHGVATDEFEYMSHKRRSQARKELRAVWGRRLRHSFSESDIILLNVDRNTHHKMWDATFDIARRVKREGHDVVLVAHTRRGAGATIEGRRSGEIGYDLPKMEKLYGLEGDVCYTDFDWGNGMTRRDLAGLYHLCDFRISTSLGEGFGIPTAEAAACGTPQILNATTTLPEVVGDPDSPWLVPPSTLISRSNDLWGMPDAAAMAQRLLELVNAPSRVATAAQKAKRHCCAEFAEPRVQSLWGAYIQELASGRAIGRAGLEGSKKGSDLWYAHRRGWGYRQKALATLAAAVETVKRLVGPGTVLEVGSFDGVFLEMALEHNIDITGIEPDPRSRERCTERARTFLESASIGYNDVWPEAACVVATDIWDLVTSAATQNVLDHIAAYEWAVLRFQRSGVWGRGRVSAELCRARLKDRGMTRREDLERMIRKNFAEHLEHEIWMRGSDTSNIPAGVRTGGK